MTNQQPRNERYEDLLWFHNSSTLSVIERFADLPGAITIPPLSNSLLYDDSSIYVPGSRKDRVLLVAHSDTVWSEALPRNRAVVSRNKNLVSTIPTVGIGADDRAGCTALWRLRNFGHSLLLCAHEERGCLGALDVTKAIPEELKDHAFALEFDRRGSHDLAVYGDHTSSFLSYLQKWFLGYRKAWGSFTDISVICSYTNLCGANLSVGYYHEHTPQEILKIRELENTIARAATLLSSSNIQKFSPPESPGFQTRFSLLRPGNQYIFDADDLEADDVDTVSDDVYDPGLDYYCSECRNLNGEDELDDLHSSSPRCVYCGTPVTRLFDGP